MTKSKKIGFACFIGGALCVAVALIATPTYWWFGLLAGIAGGYLSYEFKQVLQAIPEAFRRATRGLASWLSDIWANAEEWSKRPHPSVCFGIIAGTLIWVSFVWFWLASPAVSRDLARQGLPTNLLVYIIIVPLAFFEALTLPIISFESLMLLGSRKKEHCYYPPYWASLPDERYGIEKECELRGKGYEPMPMTYRNGARWLAKGLGLVISFFVWSIWKYLTIGIWRLLCLAMRFVWWFFKLIHSRERMLCAVDGTIGGAIVYLWFAPASSSLAGHIVLVLFGGLLGAGFGVVNYEVVSKRILHLVPRPDLVT